MFFHNLKNYDGHLIMSKANEMNGRLNKKRRIEIIPQNSEKFITFSFGSLQFKDSFSFLSSSLDQLVKSNKYDYDKKLDNWTEHFKFTNRNPYVKDDYDLDLLTEKGAYPYDYMTDVSKFDATALPSKQAFFSYLYEEDITDEDYRRAQKIWEHFNIKNLGEYHDLYLMTDVPSDGRV